MFHIEWMIIKQLDMTTSCDAFLLFKPDGEERKERRRKAIGREKYVNQSILSNSVEKCRGRELNERSTESVEE